VNQLSRAALSATAFYVFIYTMWLKRRSKQNIVIGGPRRVPVLIGWPRHELPHLDAGAAVLVIFI